MALPSDDPPAASSAVPPVRLYATDPALAPLCREIEARIAASGVGSVGDVDVELVLDFTDPSFAEHARLARNRVLREPAVHLPPGANGRPRVLVNGAVFWQESAAAQRAILSHEVAHGVRALAGVAAGFGFEEEVGTDRLACAWGFGEELIPERAKDYGDRYAAALACWAEPEKADEMFMVWNNQRIAGIITVPRRRLT